MPVSSPQLFLAWVGILASDISSGRASGVESPGSCQQRAFLPGSPTERFPTVFLYFYCLVCQNRSHIGASFPKACGHMATHNLPHMSTYKLTHAPSHTEVPTYTCFFGAVPRDNSMGKFHHRRGLAISLDKNGCS